MANYDETRETSATGNAEGLQKLEIEGFSEETKIWAWKTFKIKAKSLSRQNHFSQEWWTAMEAEALMDLLSDDAIIYEPASGKTVDEYLRGVISRKLKHAAAKIADERSIWTESRRSLDAGGCSEEEASALVDLVTSEANLETNRKLIEQPRAVSIRNTIKRLRNAKDHAALAWFLQSLKVNEVGCGVPLCRNFGLTELPLEGDCESGSEASEEGVTPEIPDVHPFAAQPADDFADDAETLNRTAFDAMDHHSKAVAEVGLAPNEEDEVPQRTFRTRSPGFGVPSSANSRLGLKGDVKELMRSLPPKYRVWCRLVKNREDPVDAYKQLKIGKNEYYKKLLPLLRKVFAELSGTY